MCNSSSIFHFYHTLIVSSLCLIPLISSHIQFPRTPYTRNTFPPSPGSRKMQVEVSHTSPIPSTPFLATCLTLLFQTPVPPAAHHNKNWNQSFRTKNTSNVWGSSLTPPLSETPRGPSHTFFFNLAEFWLVGKSQPRAGTRTSYLFAGVPPQQYCHVLYSMSSKEKRKNNLKYVL